MQTEINFSLAHPDKRIMVGEFGALRWADGADRWLNDCIELFEEYGWDWCNHSPSGWNGYNVTYSPDRENWQATAPDGGMRGAAWRILHEGFQLNGRDEYGIPNGWKARHFGAATGAKTEALDDWDADGMNNLDEYRAGTIPPAPPRAFKSSIFESRAVAATASSGPAWPENDTPSRDRPIWRRDLPIPEPSRSSRPHRSIPT